jgi:hypothetical protein
MPSRGGTKYSLSLVQIWAGTAEANVRAGFVRQVPVIS